MSSPEPDTVESVHAELEDHFSNRTEDLVWYHRLGRLFDRLKSVTPHGAGWRKQIGLRYMLTKEETYQAWRFACRCDERDARRWDGRITLGKISAALVVKNRHRFVEIIDRAVRPKKAWAHRAISAEVGLEVVSNPPRGGPKPARPRPKGVARDAAAYLRQLGRVADVRNTIFALPLSGLLAAVQAGAATGDEPRDVKTRDMVTALVAQMADIGRALVADADHLRAALDEGQRRSR